MRELTSDEARRVRSASHLLRGSELTPTAVVDRAVALQGQDLPAVLRAIALRSAPGTSPADVVRAFDQGAIVRSWPMRGTLFAVTPSTLSALRAHTHERTHRSTVRRREQLGLDDRTLGLAAETARDALSERPRTRAEILALWQASGIDTEAGRGYHLILHHSVGGLMHWGGFAAAGREQVLTLSTEPEPDDAEAALVAIVHDFVVARGPVSLDDLSWWTKLPKAVLRRAAGEVSELQAVSVDGREAWVIGDPVVPDADGVRLLPAFDEWILGYRNRDLVASPTMHSALVPGANGVFRPSVLVDGRVVGTWRAPRGTAPEADLVERVRAATRREIDAALAALPPALS